MEYMRTIPSKFFDLAVVDPPSGINAPNMKMGEHGKYESTATKLKKGRLNQGAGKLKDRAIQMLPVEWDYAPPAKEYFDELFRVSKNQIIWGGNYFNLPPTRGIICWDKMQPWENFSQIELAWTSFDCPAKMVRISTTGGANKEKKIHPTQKPTRLLERLLALVTKEGTTILDPFSGSASTAIACLNTNRNYIGFEIDKEYYDKSIERIKKQEPRLF
ncbi:MAG: site-specific DNA-methyltransferase [Bacteroides sp.]|jgi:site-specific DNA-methyltransferase (adenine-specific)|nr:site-specific DNA-methyltransferase [Bacteroides sp.]